MGEIKIQTGIAVFILIIVVFILLMWIGGWECKNDKNCSEDEICTVKHSCYKPEISEKVIYKTENRFTTAAFVLGICIIIAAFVLRNKRLGFFNKIKNKK